MYQHLNFEKSYSLQFPLLSDIGASVADLYGSKLDIPFMGKFANRLTFIIGSDGKIEKVCDIKGKYLQDGNVNTAVLCCELRALPLRNREKLVFVVRPSRPPARNRENLVAL